MKASISKTQTAGEKKPPGQVVLRIAFVTTL